MSLAVLIAQIDTSVVNLAVKSIGAEMRAPVAAMQWVLDAYNVTYASLLLTAGVFADRFGRRLIFGLGLLLFAGGSLICGLAPDVVVLIGGRAIAGIGAALAVPTSLAILAFVYPDPDERTQALGIWASCNGLAFIIGPTLGGAIVNAAGWRAIFILVIPLCLIALALTAAVVPESRAGESRRLDGPGQILAMICLVGLALGAIEGPRWSWLSMPSMLVFAVSITTGALFVLRQARTASPLVPLFLFRNPAFAGSLIVAGCMTFGMYAMLFLTPLYLQAGRGDSALGAGLALLPMSIAFVAFSQGSGLIVKRIGPRVTMAAGMSLMGLGMTMLALIPWLDAMWFVALSLLIIGCGLGLNTGPVNAVAVASVPPTRTGTASGLLNTARMVGATLGVAVLGALFAVLAGSGLDMGRGLPAPYLGGALIEFLGAIVVLRCIPHDALRA
jgi:EmrB/QacA subfamily drug resistance transporter